MAARTSGRPGHGAGRPGPYQLPSGVSRAVVLPHGPDLLILGGLSQRSAATATVRLLNPVTGSTTGRAGWPRPRRARPGPS